VKKKVVEREMVRRKGVKRLARGAAKSMSSKDWAQQALSLAQTARMTPKLKGIRKKRARKMVSANAQMAGWSLNKGQNIDEKVTREDQRVAKAQLLAKQRANYVQTQVQNAAQKLQNTTVRLGLEKERPQRLRTNVSQANAQFKSNASALKLETQAGMANLQFRRAKLLKKQQNDARNLRFAVAELQQNAKEFQANIRQKQQNQKINAAIKRSNLLENARNIKIDRANYVQTKRFEAQAGKLMKRQQLANARNARNWSRSAMKTEPARQIAELLMGPQPRKSEIFAAAMRPQFNLPSAAAYRVPNIYNGPASRNFQVT
jgi:hypothetical protein